MYSSKFWLLLKSAVPNIVTFDNNEELNMSDEIIKDKL